MNPINVTTQHVTNASGTIAIASTSTSLGVTRVISEAPIIGAEQLIDTANTILTTADVIGMFSGSILLMSFMWNVYATKRRMKMTMAKAIIDEKYYVLRKSEHELEIQKHKNNLGD
jgi:hypothetical protein